VPKYANSNEELECYFIIFHFGAFGISNLFFDFTDALWREMAARPKALAVIHGATRIARTPAMDHP
jgi:hypothetical protein